MGTFIGLCIEKSMAIGKLIICLITQKDSTELINHLKSKGCGVTSMDAQGAKGKVHVIYLIIKRRDFENIDGIIRKFNPKAFYTVEDVRLVSKGIFPLKKTGLSKSPLLDRFRYWRKGK